MARQGGAKGRHFSRSWLRGAGMSLMSWAFSRLLGWLRDVGGGFVGRPGRGRVGRRAPTIAVRSVRSGLPLRHPRCRLTAAAYGFPRAHRGCPPPDPPAPRAASVLGRGAARPQGSGKSCWARLEWPPGRPLQAYAVWDVARGSLARRRGGCARGGSGWDGVWGLLPDVLAPQAGWREGFSRHGVGGAEGLSPGEGLYTLALCFMFKILSISTSARLSSR